MDQPIAITSVSTSRGRVPGAQPIPGYRLIEPLGKGGFGEVWKCEAPGGLYKAIKFVPNQDEASGPANQEQKALQLVKAIRHPFILSLERVETIDSVLVIVMELADKSLYGLLGDYQSQNLCGIPREELLGYLLEAAEALDWMNFGHGLQHLDIKPHNLFLISNHLKVADFGLVDRLTDMEKSHPTQRQGGITPLYAAPELLNGTVSRHCDQYSLAIVYQQLLTGTLPFWCQNMYQLMLLHMTAEPNLTSLSSEDRPVVARALSKRAEDRYPSCLDFLQALVCGENGGKADLPRRAAGIKRFIAPPQLEVATPADLLQSAASAASTVPSVSENSDIQVNTPLLRVVAAARRSLSTECNLPAVRQGSAASTGLATTCVSLPGYRFLKCTGQTPLGDIWKAQDESGRPRRALCLHNFIERDSVLVERLQSFLHPALPRVEAIWSPSGRLVLITEEYEQTLRDRLEDCKRQGLPGIPRDELLGYLRRAAEAIDELYRQHGLPHLGLNPRTLVLHGENLTLLDYGLVPLLWLPTGQSGGSLNGRYAAPELFDQLNLTGIPSGDAMRTALMGRAGSTSDQFGLALIYAEMLNGIPPQSPRAKPPSQRRSPRRGNSDPEIVPGRSHSRVDLDLLPSCDRDIFLKALHDDPQHRFATCTEMVAALEAAATGAAHRAQIYHRLPRVIPFSSLQGEPPPKNIALPPINQLVLSLALPQLVSKSQTRTICGPLNSRYIVRDDVWEYNCPTQLFSGALLLRVEGFRAEWDARIVEQKSDFIVLHIDLSSAVRWNAREPASLVFELGVQSLADSANSLVEVRMRIFPGGGDRSRILHLLPELAPKIFDCMRCYLLARPDQRTEDRWQCPLPLHVYPVQPDLELDEVLDGISRNISMGGVSIRVATPPRTEQAYLHWHKSPNASPYAVLVRLVRVQPMAGGGFEVGGVFSG